MWASVIFVWTKLWVSMHQMALIGYFCQVEFSNPRIYLKPNLHIIHGGQWRGSTCRCQRLIAIKRDAFRNTHENNEETIVLFNLIKCGNKGKRLVTFLKIVSSVLMDQEGKMNLNNFSFQWGCGTPVRPKQKYGKKVTRQWFNSFECYIRIIYQWFPVKTCRIKHVNRIRSFF